MRPTFAAFPTCALPQTQACVPETVRRPDKIAFLQNSRLRGEHCNRSLAARV